MKCPNCGKAMQAGFLQTCRIVAFNKTRHEVSLNPKDKDDVMIAKKFFLNADSEGCICKECGLIVFDYKNILFRF